MTLRRHLLLLASLAACGPGKFDTLDTGDSLTGTDMTGPDSMSSNPSIDPSITSFPTSTPDPSTPTSATTVATITTTPTTVDPTATVTTQPTVTVTSETVSSITFDSDVSFISDFTESNSFDTETVFIFPSDVSSHECDIFAEDCPPGLKCMPFDSNKSGSWNDLKCTPVLPDAQPPGAPCFVEGSGVSGVDNCQLHAMCFNVDPDTLQGECVAMCTGSEQQPVCPPDSACTIANEGVLALCLALCDPLDIAACPAGQVCAFSNDFLCIFDASGDDGQLFDDCQFINDCDPGFACIDASVVPQCDADFGCCSNYCDLTQPNLCPPQLVCTPWFDQGQAPPGFEDVGVCTSTP